MLRFYYDTFYKYTNRALIDLTDNNNYVEYDYENIDSADTINGHIIYTLTTGETIPTYILDTTKNQRWFVSGITQLRTGKYQISLLRDILSENDYWKDERAYIEAGTASDYCKYKKWNLPFTNTKVRSQRFDINGKSSFFVFYVNQREVDEGTGVVTESDLILKYTNTPGSTTVQHEYDSLSDIPGYSYIGNKFAYIDDANIHGLMTDLNESFYGYYDGMTFSNDGLFGDVVPTFLKNQPIKGIVTPLRLNVLRDYNNDDISDAVNAATNEYVSGLINSQYDPSIPISTVNKVDIAELDSIVGQLIKVGNDYYKVRVNEKVVNSYSTRPSINSSIYTTLINYLNTAIRPTFHAYTDGIEATNTEIVVEYELVPQPRGINCELTLKADIAKLPRSSVRCVNIVSDDNISDDEIAQLLMLCQSNANVESDDIGRIIDVQYLPFSIATSTNANIKFGSHDATATFITNDDFVFNKNMPDLTGMNKETDSIVIVSPSRKSQYQFSPYNNDGNMEFDVRTTLKPYQSVIYIRPSTKGLLMNDWNDKDCLIIQEDFSLTVVNSDWANYVYNNRNFQNTFNLEMQSKEYQRDWERKIEAVQKKSDYWNAKNFEAEKARSVINIPIVGDMTGSIASWDSSAVRNNEYMQAAQLDRQYNEAMYQHSVSIARQNFEFQLENVKTQPLIPNTITALDCKMLDGVYLEFYSTNPTELASIENFYKNNGNRIDNYGTFRNYYGGFIRGRIILSNKYTQPEIDEINRRLTNGIYTEGGIL